MVSVRREQLILSIVLNSSVAVGRSRDMKYEYCRWFLALRMFLLSSHVYPPAMCRRNVCRRHGGGWCNASDSFSRFSPARRQRFARPAIDDRGVRIETSICISGEPTLPATAAQTGQDNKYRRWPLSKHCEIRRHFPCFSNAYPCCIEHEDIIVSRQQVSVHVLWKY